MRLLVPEKLETGDLYLRLNSAQPCRSLATTIYGGGLAQATGVLVTRVDPEYDCPLPEDWARKKLEELGLPQDTIVFLTAANPHNYSHARGPRGRAEALATVALSHPACPSVEGSGDNSGEKIAPGTVNLVVAVTARLNDAALVDAFRTASEAKAGFLALSGLSCGRTPAWSTVSDATALIQCHGPPETYAGPGTQVGSDIAMAVVEALAQHPGLRAPSMDWLLRNLTGHSPEELVEAGLRALTLARAPLPPGGKEEARRKLQEFLENALRDPNTRVLLMAARLAESSGLIGAMPGMRVEDFRSDSRVFIVDELLAWALSNLLGGFKTVLSTIWVDKNKDLLGIRSESVLLDDIVASLVGHLVTFYLDKVHSTQGPAVKRV